MTQEQALQILIQTAQIAVERGGFKLADAKAIGEAVEVFLPKKEEAPVEDVKKGKK